MLLFVCCVLALKLDGPVKLARSLFEQGSGGVVSAIDIVKKSWVGIWQLM